MVICALCVVVSLYFADVDCFLCVCLSVCLLCRFGEINVFIIRLGHADNDRRPP